MGISLAPNFPMIAVPIIISSGAPLRYRSANFLHIGGAVLDGLRQHVGIADQADDAVVNFHAIEQRPQVAFSEWDRTFRDVFGNELTESREDLVGKILLTRSRRLEPFELGIDLGDLISAQSDSALDFVVNDVAVLDECLVPG